MTAIIKAGVKNKIYSIKRIFLYVDWRMKTYEILHTTRPKEATRVCVGLLPTNSQSFLFWWRDRPAFTPAAHTAGS